MHVDLSALVWGVSTGGFSVSIRRKMTRNRHFLMIFNRTRETWRLSNLLLFMSAVVKIQRCSPATSRMRMMTYGDIATPIFSFLVLLIHASSNLTQTIRDSQ